MKQISLNNLKNNSVKVVSSEDIHLTTNQRAFSPETAETTLDYYKLYLDERNNCRNYKMFFTIRPYMTNVLFNAFTEIVFDEGTSIGDVIGDEKNFSNIAQHNLSYAVMNNETLSAIKSNNFNGSRRYQLIRDTEYSHPDLCNNKIKYHCGLDIFNNHYLRSNGFFGIHKQTVKNDVFNTILDLQKCNDGKDNVIYYCPEPGSYKSLPDETLFDKLGKKWDAITQWFKGQTVETTKIREVNLHMFNRRNCDPVIDAVAKNIKDENGWVGFYNKAYTPIKNVGNLVVNRCINYENACSFIDMYPDRTLFSLLPNINYNNGGKEEYNWEWVLTYPYKHVTVDSENKDFDFFNERGLKVIWNSTSSFFMKTDANDEPEDILSGLNVVIRDDTNIYFRTKCKHNLTVDSSVVLSYEDNGNFNEFSIRVRGVGDKAGKNKAYYFYVSYDDLFNEIGGVFDNEIHMECVEIPQNIYVRRVVDGVSCKYYVRKFKRLSPNKLSSTINKVAFSRTIYNDNIAQIIFDENINVEGLKDNLGRDVSEVYLTFIKNNSGYKEYYHEGETKNISFSHCFGRLTSGFNFETNEDEVLITNPQSSVSNNNFRDYNVRSLYNLDNFDTISNGFLKNMGFKFAPPKNIETEITVSDDEFYGDFVEFSPAEYRETVLEDVYHRFNTAQRETRIDGDGFPCDFSCFKYDEIVYDDYDFKNDEELIAESADFTVRINDNGLRDNPDLYGHEDSPRDNIFPEGYFYKPHHRVVLNEFSEILKSNNDTVLSVNPIVNDYGIYGFYYVDTAIPYYLTSSDKIKVVYEDGSYSEYYVHQKSKGNRIVFQDAIKTPEKVKTNVKYIYYCNTDIPEYAYYVDKGVGKYVWREISKDSELPLSSEIYNRTYANGALYVNTNINLYVRRQDPYGIYGLKYTREQSGLMVNYQVDGSTVKKPDAYYNTQENNMQCEL